MDLQNIKSKLSHTENKTQLSKLPILYLSAGIFKG